MILRFHVCPVCDYAGLLAPPQEGPVCPSCGTEFEVDDRYRSHLELRAAWLEAGAPWFSKRVPAPHGWEKYRQQLLVEHQVRQQPEDIAGTDDIAADPVFIYPLQAHGGIAVELSYA